jgi:histidyl-tRNA synthetase
VLRALDKFDRFGERGVRALLGEGRKDESGDFTKGAELSEDQIGLFMMFFELGQQPTSNSDIPAEEPDTAYVFAKYDPKAGGLVSEVSSRPVTGSLPISNLRTIAHFRSWLPQNTLISNALDRLEQIAKVVDGCGFGSLRIQFDPSIIRGLEYYTGPVFEAQLTFPVTNEQGETVVFGSVAGGGRYDDLVARFTGQQVPATGISIGVSRLLAALTSRGLVGDVAPLVIVLGMGDTVASFRLAKELRAAGVRAEAYVGTKKIPDQLKYADKRGAALVVMEGDDERAAGNVTIKDLKLGAELAKQVESRADYLGARAAQETVKRDALVTKVKEMLGL